MNLSGMRCKSSEMKVKGLEWDHVNVRVSLVE
jgi:hypothetical protein